MHTNQPCPACSAKLVLELDYDSGRASVPWYKLAPIRNYCASCRVEVAGVVSRNAVFCLAALVSIMLISIIALNMLEGAGTISPTSFDNSLSILAGAVLIGTGLIGRFLFRYKIVADSTV